MCDCAAVQELEKLRDAMLEHVRVLWRENDDNASFYNGKEYILRVYVERIDNRIKELKGE